MVGSCRGLFAFCLVLTLAACSPSKPTFKGADITGVDWGGDVRLQAHTGERVSTASFRGKLLILFFGYSHCPDVCSPTLAKLAMLRKALRQEGERVQVIFITVDPAHDTAQQLAGFVPKFDRSFIGLTGTPEEIAVAAREYKIGYAPRPVDPAAQIDHSSGIFVKDASGKLRLLWRNDISVDDMEHDVRLLMGG
jgi:protein SCO1/2